MVAVVLQSGSAPVTVPQRFNEVSFGCQFDIEPKALVFPGAGSTLNVNWKSPP